MICFKVYKFAYIQIIFWLVWIRFAMTICLEITPKYLRTEVRGILNDPQSVTLVIRHDSMKQDSQVEKGNTLRK